MFKRLAVREFQAKTGNRAGRARAVGFTILELMIVITIIFILMGVAVGRYDQTVKRAREARLKHDLQVLRVAIDNYTLDKQAAPQSLQDLVDARYLRSLPYDSITQAQDWVVHTGDTVISPDQIGTGIDDVHSNSEQISTEGNPYSAW
jgi:general secretion pathway protein G